VVFFIQEKNAKKNLKGKYMYVIEGYLQESTRFFLEEIREKIDKNILEHGPKPPFHNHEGCEEELKPFFMKVNTPPILIVI
jgi:hypothetical protein